MSEVRFSDSELEVMCVLWDGGEQGLAGIMAQLQDRGKRWAPSTVQTFLTRLAKKGAVNTRHTGNRLLYSAATDRQETESREMGRLYRQLFGSSARALISTLLDNEKLSLEELEQLREVIDDYARGGGVNEC